MINWDAIGAIGEIVGALGVIVTVGYLAIQVRQNTFASRAQTYQERTNASRDLIRWSAEPSMLQALMAERKRRNASQPTTETLSDEDRAKVAAFARAQFQH